MNTEQRRRDAPVSPEHPMVLEGGVVRGNTRFMMQCIFEDMLMSGTSLASLRQMTLSPRYQALYAGRVTLGDEATDALLESVVKRVGGFRVSVSAGGCSGGAAEAKNAGEETVDSEGVA